MPEHWSYGDGWNWLSDRFTPRNRICYALVFKRSTLTITL